MRYRMMGALALGGVALLALAATACGGRDNADASPANGNAAVNGAGANLQAQTTTTGEGISVSGQGIASVKPDTALLSLGVSIVKPTAREARDAAATSMDALLASVKSNDVSHDDIKTTQFTLNAEYEYPSFGSPHLTGYRVTNTISVKVRDIDRAAEVLDEAVDAVGDPLQVGGISFTVDNQDAVLSTARSQAMAAAKSKAEELASLAGVTLGAPVSINESSSGGGGYPPVYYGASIGGAPAAADTSIQTGQLDITVSVQVTYAIQ